MRTIEDSIALSEGLVPGRQIVIIGAGFIGCEVAAAALSRGCSVTVVALDAAPMLLPLGPSVGAALRRRHEQAGVIFHLGRTVAGIDAGAGMETVVLDDGTRLEADLVVEAIGTVPNTQWLAGNDLDLTNGVLCDNWMRMGGRSAMVAVGDVARFPNAMFGGPARRIEHWQIPGETAVRAAATLLSDLNASAEDVVPFAVLPTFWSNQGVISIRAFGAPALGGRAQVLEGDLDADAAIGYYRDDVLVGVVLLGLAKQAGFYVRELTTALRPAPAT